MSNIPDFTDTERSTVEQTVKERYGKPIDVQSADAEIRLYPDDRELTSVPVLYWEARDALMADSSAFEDRLPRAVVERFDRERLDSLAERNRLLYDGTVDRFVPAEIYFQPGIRRAVGCGPIGLRIAVHGISCVKFAPSLVGCADGLAADQIVGECRLSRLAERRERRHVVLMHKAASVDRRGMSQRTL